MFELLAGEKEKKSSEPKKISLKSGLLLINSQKYAQTLKNLIIMQKSAKHDKGALHRYNLKLILLGDGGVGKTSLVEQFIIATFNVDYKITIGVNIMTKLVTLDEKTGETANLVINDVAGQPRFEVMRQTFYAGAQVIMAVCDLTRKHSLDNLASQWIPELIGANPSKKEYPPMHLLLIGNKCDLEDLRTISKDDLEDAMKQMTAKFPQIQIIGYLETSAKNNIAVNDAFIRLAKEYVIQLKKLYPIK